MLRPIQVSTIGRSLLQQPFKSRRFAPFAAWSCQGRQWIRPLTQLHAQRSTSSTSKVTAMSLPSSEQVISDWLKNNKFDKWGWVIYRCTYNDDEGWTRFKQFIIQQSHTHIAECDTPELADSLEWTFVEDRATLDGVSKG
jgi:hypothetical protein